MTSRMRIAYRALLRLYPYDYRLWFASEMLAGFDVATTERGAALRELRGLIKGCAEDWIAKLTADPLVRARALPDWRMMRPAGVSQRVWFVQETRSCSSAT